MDLAYDHIVESNLPQDPLAKKEGEGQGEQVAQAASTINADFQEAYKAISSSPWGARLGGWMGSVVKQVCGSMLRREELLHLGPPALGGKML